MAKQCEICGKGTSFGNNVSHAHNVTSRSWEPNLQRVRALSTAACARSGSARAACAAARSSRRPARKWTPEAEAAKS